VPQKNNKHNKKACAVPKITNKTQYPKIFHPNLPPLDFEYCVVWLFLGPHVLFCFLLVFLDLHVFSLVFTILIKCTMCCLVLCVFNCNKRSFSLSSCRDRTRLQNESAFCGCHYASHTLRQACAFGVAADEWIQSLPFRTAVATRNGALFH
jgi:hypothetical protein